MFKWLDDNPVVSIGDVAFLTKTVLFKRNIATQAFDASKAEMELLEKLWRGKYPYLR